jgi:hypothetical protein
VRFDALARFCEGVREEGLPTGGDVWFGVGVGGWIVDDIGRHGFELEDEIHCGGLVYLGLRVMHNMYVRLDISGVARGRWYVLSCMCFADLCIRKE